VRIGARSSLAGVAVAVRDALRRHGIQAVLTGGACASLLTDRFVEFRAELARRHRRRAR